MEYAGVSLCYIGKNGETNPERNFLEIKFSG